MIWVQHALSALAELRERQDEAGAPGVHERLDAFREAYLGLREAGADRPLAELGSERLDVQIGRTKGAWVLWMLRDRVGEPLFSELLAAREAREDLRGAVSRTLAAGHGKPAPVWVDPFFDFWVHGTGLPDYRLTAARAQARDGGFEVTLRVINRGTGAFPAPAVVQTEEGARHAFPVSVPPGRTEPVAYALLTRPVAAAIDPEGSVLSATPPRGWETVRVKRWWIF